MTTRKQIIEYFIQSFEVGKEDALILLQESIQSIEENINKFILPVQEHQRNWIKAAHTIKGTAGNCHFIELETLAKELELKTKEGDFQTCETLISQITILFNQFKNSEN